MILVDEFCLKGRALTYHYRINNTPFNHTITVLGKTSATKGFVCLDGAGANIDERLHPREDARNADRTEAFSQSTLNAVLAKLAIVGVSDPYSVSMPPSNWKESELIATKQIVWDNLQDKFCTFSSGNRFDAQKNEARLYNSLQMYFENTVLENRV